MKCGRRPPEFRDTVHISRREIYFDIWPDICTDDIAEAQALQRRFRKYLNPGGYMKSWTTLANQALGRR